MKFLIGLVLVLAYISACSAAANRSTIWLIGDELIYTTTGYQKCAQAASSQNKTLVTTKYFTITTGSATTDVKYYKKLGDTAANAATNQGGTYILNTMQLSFVYGDGVTPNLAFTLPSFSNLFVGTAGTYSNLITSIIAPGNYPNAYGNTWLSVRIVNGYKYSSDGTQAAANAATLSAASVLITDYRSSSTILVTQYQDGDDVTTAGAEKLYNHLYSVIIRTPTSLLTTSTDILVGGCTTTGRGSTTTQSSTSLTCSTYLSTAATYESSFSGVSCTTTDTAMPDALALSIAGVSSLRTQDNALFGAAGSKFTIAASFGFFIAMSSIFFNL